MITKDFYGNNFVWWTGRVEERTGDPLKQGAVRVRIFGLHSDNEQQVPIEALPWAQVVAPPNGVKSFSVPRRGDFVFGFFQDGPNAQIPVVLGVYRGVESQYSNLADQQNQPTPPEGIVVREVEKPLNARLSRSIVEGTIVNKTNNELTKACDITSIIQYDTAKVKLYFSNVMQQIRDAIRAFLLGLGFGDPSGEVRKVIQLAKEVLAEIKRVIKVFREIRQWIQLIRDVIQRIQQFIQYILSLPAKFAQLIRECLNSILSSITTQVQNLANIPGLNVGSGDLNSVLTALTSLATRFGGSVPSITNALNGVPNSFKDVLQTPSLSNLATATNTHLSNLIRSFPTPDQVKSNTSFDTFSSKSKNLGP